MKTLIVQPNTEMAEWMRQVVAAIAPGEVEVVSSPTSAASETYDVILTEAHFEEANGLEWLAHVKASLPAAKLAVVSTFDLSGWQEHFGDTPFIFLPEGHEKLSAFLASAPVVADAENTGQPSLNPVFEEEPAPVVGPAPAVVPVADAASEPLPVVNAPEKKPAMAAEALPRAGGYSQQSAAPVAAATKGAGLPAAALPRAGGMPMQSTVAKVNPATAGLVRRPAAAAPGAVAMPRRAVPTGNLPPGVAAKPAQQPVTGGVSDKTIVSSPAQIAKIEQAGGGVPANAAPQAGVSDKTIISSPSVIQTIERQGVQAAQAAKVGAPVTVRFPSASKGLVKRDVPAWVVMLKLDKLKPWQWIASGITVVLVILGWFGLWLWDNYYSEPPMTEFYGAIAIPAGEYDFGEGDKVQKVTVPNFWVDEYEVTFGQYKRFLESVTGQEKKFAPEGMPATKTSFAPTNWPELLEAIRRRKQFHGAQLTYDHPIVNVDWYDAMAYAKWAGKRLPTEQEWEVAARYPKGWLYPWTEKFDPQGDDRTKANLGLDYAPNKPVDGGKIDGFNGPNPVNRKETDATPAGVKGTFGNVREWTASRGGGLLQGSQAPILCGGSFMMQKDFNLATRGRRIGITEDTRKEDIGFRCISDKSPAVAPAKQ